MQNLEVISVNIWHILISLCNLLILFLILKKFLYAPVKKVMAQRRAVIDESYSAAEEAQQKADADKAEWAKRLELSKSEADIIIKTAETNAANRENEIISEARERANDIIRAAENEAELRKRKAEDEIKHEIVDVSALLTEKLLEREITEDDHRALIVSFIAGVGSGEAEK